MIRAPRPGPSPPRLAERLLRRVGAGGPAGLSVLGDLREEHAGLRRRRGRLTADAWFWWQALAVAFRLALGRRRRSLASGSGGGELRGGRGHAGSWAADVVRSARRLARERGHAGVVVAVLALGIAASTTAFSLMNWVLLRPVPGVASTEGLVTLRFMGRGSQGVQYTVPHPLLAELRDRSRTLAELGAYTPVAVHLGAGDRAPRRVDAQMVTGNFFDVLGLRMAAGRGFTPAEGEDPDRAAVVVLSTRLARELFGDVTAPVGSILRLSGHPFEVVGVAADGFRGAVLPGSSDLWVPIAAVRRALPHYRLEILTDRRAATWRQMIGRLAPGISLDAADAELEALAVQVAREFGENAWFGALDPLLTTGIGMAPSLRDRMRRTFTLMMSAAGLLLLLACADVAHLTVARATRRRRELAIRRALGATRGRLVREVLAESLLLALAGGVFALALTLGLVQLFRESAVVSWLPELGDVSLDLRVLAFTVVVAVFAGVASGLVPALGAVRDEGVMPSRHPTDRATRRVLDGLVVTQIALSLPLLVAAGLMLRTVSNLRGVDLGFDPRNVVSVSVEPAVQGFGPERTRALYGEIVRRVDASPEIEAVGIGYPAPFGGVRAGARLARWGTDPAGSEVEAEHMQVTGGFHEALSITLLEGPGFEAPRIAETSSRRQVVLSESLARELFPDGPAVGRQVRIEVGGARSDRPHEVVGVVGDARLLGLAEEPRRVAYQLLGDPYLPIQTAIIARAATAPERAAAAIRRALAEIAPALPPFDVGPLEARMDRTIAGERLLARLGGSMALLAAALAAAAILGVVATTVDSRSRELGIRLAVGASPRSLVGRLLGRYLLAGALGVGIGLVGSAWLSRWLESRLFEIDRFDPATLLAAAAAALAVTVLASLVPARRVMQLDPVRTLTAN